MNEGENVQNTRQEKKSSTFWIIFLVIFLVLLVVGSVLVFVLVKDSVDENKRLKEVINNMSESSGGSLPKEIIEERPSPTEQNDSEKKQSTSQNNEERTKKEEESNLDPLKLSINEGIDFGVLNLEDYSGNLKVEKEGGGFGNSNQLFTDYSKVIEEIDSGISKLKSLKKEVDKAKVEKDLEKVRSEVDKEWIEMLIIERYAFLRLQPARAVKKIECSVNEVLNGNITYLSSHFKKYPLYEEFRKRAIKDKHIYDSSKQGFVQSWLDSEKAWEEFWLNPPTVNCSSGPLPPKEEESEEGCKEGYTLVNKVCLPNLINSMGSKDYAKVLNKIVINHRATKGYQEYQPMKTKVQELISGIDSNYEKAVKIINWVHKSKDYCSEADKPIIDELFKGCTPANEEKTNYSYLFENELGICFDAALLAGTMLKTAEIPATFLIVEAGHALAVFSTNNKLYWADPTFCPNKSECSDVEIINPLEGEIDIVSFTDNSGRFKNQEGKYCNTEDLCLDLPFEGNKEWIFYEGDTFHAFFPRSNLISKNNPGVQYTCTFETPLECTWFKGCEFLSFGEEGELPEETLDGLKELGEDAGWNQRFLSENIYYSEEGFEEGSQQIFFGYSYSELPAKRWYKLECWKYFKGHSEGELLVQKYIYPKKDEKIIVSDLEILDGANQTLFEDLRASFLDKIKGINASSLEVP